MLSLLVCWLSKQDLIQGATQDGLYVTLAEDMYFMDKWVVNEWVNAWLKEWMHEWTSVWMNERTNDRMHGWMDGWMNEWMKGRRNKGMSDLNEWTACRCYGAAGMSAGHCSRLPRHRHENLRHHDEERSPQGDGQGVTLSSSSRPQWLQEVFGWWGISATGTVICIVLPYVMSYIMSWQILLCSLYCVIFILYVCVLYISIQYYVFSCMYDAAVCHTNKQADPCWLDGLAWADSAYVQLCTQFHALHEEPVDPD